MNQQMPNQRDIERTETLADELEVRTSNGNRDHIEHRALTDDEEAIGGAEKGGPDLDKARERMPPDAQIDQLDLDRSLH